MTTSDPKVGAASKLTLSLPLVAICLLAFAAWSFFSSFGFARLVAAMLLLSPVFLWSILEGLSGRIADAWLLGWLGKGIREDDPSPRREYRSLELELQEEVVLATRQFADGILARARKMGETGEDPGPPGFTGSATFDSLLSGFLYSHPARQRRHRARWLQARVIVPPLVTPLVAIALVHKHGYDLAIQSYCVAVSIVAVGVTCAWEGTFEPSALIAWLKNPNRGPALKVFHSRAQRARAQALVNAMLQDLREHLAEDEKMDERTTQDPE